MVVLIINDLKNDYIPVFIYLFYYIFYTSSLVFQEWFLQYNFKKHAAKVYSPLYATSFVISFLNNCCGYYTNNNNIDNNNTLSKWQKKKPITG